jgi:hypothetical protein
MSEYKKYVEVTDTGMVIASVYFGDNRKGVEFFSSLFGSNKSIEKRCRRAHKWADERIKVCARQERNKC